MSRLVLASSFMGKTYTNNNYENVYDFDQHTLSYKYTHTSLMNSSKAYLVEKSGKAGLRNIWMISVMLLMLIIMMW